MANTSLTLSVQLVYFTGSRAEYVVVSTVLVWQKPSRILSLGIMLRPDK